MRISLERPEEKEIHHLIEKYGQPTVRDFLFDHHERDEKEDYPKCKGGCRILIRRDGRTVLVSHGPAGGFYLPGGRIWERETVEEGAIREAREETGLDVELKKMPELHKCQYLFKDWNLERWVFIFIATCVGGSLEPQDKGEIHQVATFESPPPHFDGVEWFQNIWKTAKKH